MSDEPHMTTAAWTPGARRRRQPKAESESAAVASTSMNTEMVDTLPQVWEMAGRMLGRTIDPLDPAVITRIVERIRR